MNVDDVNIAIVLVALAAVHISEEAAKGFRGFFNTEWFEGSKNCPVGRKKGLLVDQVGLFLVLAFLAVFGALLYPPFFLVAVGVISADLVQHASFSIAKRRYTPGVATSVLYLLYIVYFFAGEEGRRLLTLGWVWVAMAVGVAFIAGNYAYASWKVQTGRCRLA
jgi:hypothetical protein